MNQTPEEALKSITIIKAKLARVIKHFVDHRVTPEGRLGADDQSAIRIVESRMRLLDRQYNAQYSSGLVKETAIQELNLGRKDNGDLVQFGEKKHGIGRFNCKACDVDYDESTTPATPVRLSRLCTRCKKGIEHAWTTIVPIRVNTNGCGGSNGGEEEEYEPLVERHFCCDCCGHQTKEVVYQ